MNIDSGFFSAPRPTSLAPRPEGAQRHSRATERLLVATASQQSGASLRVVTDDGDVLTLSAHQESSVTYTDYRRNSRGPEGSERQRLQVFEASSRQSFSIEIQGTLDDAERADLESLIQRVAASFRQFEQGDAAGAQALLQGGGDLGSLDSFAVHFEREQSVTVSELMRRTLAIGEREETAALPLRQPAPAPVPVTPVPTESPAIPRPGAETLPVEPSVAPWREAGERRNRSDHHHPRTRARAARVLDQLMEKLAQGRPAFDVEKFTGMIREALAQPALEQPAPGRLPVTEAPVDEITFA